jgi:glutamyl-tRNA reductase
LAEAMIVAEVAQYQRRLHALNVTPEIVQLQQSAEQMRRGELRRLASRLQTLSAEQQAAVEALTRGLVNKFLHQPVQAIKAAASEGNTAAVDAIREAFGAPKARGAGEGPPETDLDESLIAAALDEERDR